MRIKTGLLFLIRSKAVFWKRFNIKTVTDRAISLAVSYFLLHNKVVPRGVPPVASGRRLVRRAPYTDDCFAVSAAGNARQGAMAIGTEKDP